MQGKRRIWLRVFKLKSSFPCNESSILFSYWSSHVCTGQFVSQMTKDAIAGRIMLSMWVCLNMLWIHLNPYLLRSNAWKVTRFGLSHKGMCVWRILLKNFFVLETINRIESVSLKCLLNSLNHIYPFPTPSLWAHAPQGRWVMKH